MAFHPGDEFEGWDEHEAEERSKQQRKRARDFDDDPPESCQELPTPPAKARQADTQKEAWRVEDEDHLRLEIGSPPTGLGEWDAGADTDKPPPRGWLLGNIFCRRFISSPIADGGTGKTALRILQAMALATGRSLTGEHAFQRCRVLIVSLEDDADELKRRILAARLHHNIPSSELSGWLFLAAPGAKAGKLKAVTEKGQVADGQLKPNLVAAIKARRIDLVILDPFVKTHRVPENSNDAVDDVAQMLSDLAVDLDIAVDLPHHVSKGSADPGNAQRGRGASALVDAGRLCYTLTPMSEEEAKTFAIPLEERRQYIRQDKAKVNLVRAGGPAKWFKLVGVRLDNATDLYPNGDEVQTVEPWSPSGLLADISVPVLNTILDDIDAGLPDGNRFSDAPNVSERAAWRVIEKHCPGKSEGPARQIIKAWIGSGLLVRKKYRNPIERKDVSGLWVNSTKRPS